MLSGFRFQMSCVVCHGYTAARWAFQPWRCAGTGSRKYAEGFKEEVETVSHTHTVYRLLIKCAAGSCYVNLRSTAVLCFTMWRKVTARGMLFTRRSQWLCYYSIPVKRDSIRKGAYFSFLLQSLWQLLSKQSPPHHRWRPVGGALFHRTWVWFLAVELLVFTWAFVSSVLYACLVS